jgi:hypothetical protein
MGSDRGGNDDGGCSVLGETCFSEPTSEYGLGGAEVAKGDGRLGAADAAGVA